RLGLELLESRTLLDASAGYLPTNHFLSNPHGFLTGPSTGEPLDIALSYVRGHAGELGLSQRDLAHPMVTDQYTDAATGLTHLYFRQQVLGLEVANADLSVTVSNSGQVLSVGGGFVPNLESTISQEQAWRQPQISAVQAVSLAAANLGLAPKAPITVVSQNP